jgi:hypothetical protein
LIALLVVTALSLGALPRCLDRAAAAQAVSCPCSMWDTSATPDTPAFDDAQPVEVGVKFRSDIDGYVTALRFYKGTDTAGAYLANLWTSGGKLLGSARVANEQQTGWVEMPLSAPVAVQARTTYVASYHTSIGRYAATPDFFASAPVSQGPLHALADGDDGGNGVFAYGASAFPTQSFKATSYWVDVVFSTSAVDTVAPDVLTVTPAADAHGIAADTKITATFTEDVAASSVALTLKDSEGATVAAKVTYDAASRTATLTPESPLAAAAAYTVSVAGATDPAGNAMSAPFVSSFTTGGTPATPDAPETAAPAGAAASGPPAPIVIPPLSVSITSDRGPGATYYITNIATVCVTVNRWATVRISHQRAGREVGVIFEGRIGGKQCAYEILNSMISGDQAWVVEAWDGDGNTVSASVPFVLADAL